MIYKYQGEFKYQDKQKASVPLRNEKPLMNLQSNKNFVVLNAVENILSGTFIINLLHLIYNWKIKIFINYINLNLNLKVPKPVTP